MEAKAENTYLADETTGTCYGLVGCGELSHRKRYDTAAFFGAASSHELGYRLGISRGNRWSFPGVADYPAYWVSNLSEGLLNPGCRYIFSKERRFFTVGARPSVTCRII